MDSGHLIFDPSASSHHHGRMLVLGGGGGGNQIFRGSRSVFGMEEGASKLRPFFTSPDQEIFEEEYYDEQSPEKKRRLTSEQVHMLERSFEAENKLEPERRSELALKLGLQPRQVAVWFQNRRARWKTKQLERDFDRLKSSYDALHADRNALVKDNDRLRSQVIFLTEKLQAKELHLPGKPENDETAATIEGISVNVEQQKIEDGLSTGSGGSAVVDEEGPHPANSSGDSYFKESYHGGECYVGVNSEEDDVGSDEGCSYLPTGIFSDQQNTECWSWVWN